jgi:hypothetical protein
MGRRDDWDDDDREEQHLDVSSADLALIHPDQPSEVLLFMQRIASGVGELNAAIEVGWSPRQLRDMMKNEDFRELVRESKVRLLETVEQKAYKLAMRGNMAAIQLVLFSQAADRGWRPPTQRVAINQQTTVTVEAIEAGKQAVTELLAEHGVRALQPPPDAIPVESDEVA